MRPPADDQATILIVSNDATAAALLGGLVETFGYRVRFTSVPAVDEQVRRARPRVCLLDCESEACDEASVARIIMRGVSAVLVGPRSLLDGMREIAARYEAELVFTPPTPEPLGEAIRRAIQRAG